METVSLDRLQLISIYGLSTNADFDNIRYIGYAVDASARLKEHLKDVNRSKVNTYKKNWIKNEIAKGNAIVLTILDTAKSYEEAKNKEIHYIKLFRSVGARLVNGTLGGDGVVCTEAVKIKMSVSRKGKLHSSETKQRFSEMRKGKPLSEAHRRNISKANKGKPGRIISEEERRKLSQIKLGKPSNARGRFISEAERNRLSKLRLGVPSAKRRAVVQIIENVIINEYPSVCEARSVAKNVSLCLTGRRKTAGGYVWKYK
jgi:hypothetical protein